MFSTTYLFKWCSIYFLISASELLTLAEYHEFKVTLPMILTSLRNFEKTPIQQHQQEFLYISKAKNGLAILKADEGYGLMAVVQEMNLQDLNHDYSNSQHHCVDYIQISQLNGSKTTGEICGNSESKRFSQPSFIAKSGQIELSYAINERIRLSPFDGNYTNFNISVTAFVECPEDAFPFGNKYLKPCSSLDPFSCIPAELFCDGVVNCGFPNEFGLDEMYCEKKMPATRIRRTTLPSIFSESDEINSEFENYFQNLYENQNAIKKPYEGYRPSEEEDIDLPFLNNIYLNTTTKPMISYYNFRYGNGLGLVFVLSIFVSLVSLSIFKRSAYVRVSVREITVHSVTDDTSRDSSKARMISGSEGYEIFDIESDPAPPYRDCVESNTHYSYFNEMCFEYEKPPKYEDVKIHQSRPPSYSEI